MGVHSTCGDLKWFYVFFLGTTKPVTVAMILNGNVSPDEGHVGKQDNELRSL